MRQTGPEELPHAVTLLSDVRSFFQPDRLKIPVESLVIDIRISYPHHAALTTIPFSSSRHPFKETQSIGLGVLPAKAPELRWWKAGLRFRADGEA